MEFTGIHGLKIFKVVTGTGRHRLDSENTRLRLIFTGQQKMGETKAHMVTRVDSALCWGHTTRGTRKLKTGLRSR